MTKTKPSALLFFVMLLFGAQVLAAPFLVCEEMQQPAHAAMDEAGYCDTMMMDTAGHGMEVMPDAEAQDCNHLCSACLANVPWTGQKAVNYAHIAGVDSPLSHYQSFIPSSRSETPFRPPITA